MDIIPQSRYMFEHITSTNEVHGVGRFNMMLKIMIIANVSAKIIPGNEWAPEVLQAMICERYFS